jgi:serine phosphatase RsbU (regulator of sigma subunit)
MMPPAPTLSPEAKYRLLLTLSQEIGRTLDLQEVLRHLLATLRTSVAYDAAGVFVLNRRVPLGQDSAHRMIAGMATVGFDDTPRDEDPMLRQGKGIIGHVVSTGQSVIASDVSQDPHYVQGRVLTRSEIAVPIMISGEVIGALNLESDMVDTYAEADLEFLEFFAVAAAISIEKAIVHLELVGKHRIEHQLAIAREVQSALLPARDPVVPGFEIGGINIPTWEIGGDYFDYLWEPDGRLAIALADVSGKGVPAALLMATFRAALRVQRQIDGGVGSTVAALNRVLLDSMDASRFVTAVYGVLAHETGEFDYVNCGHNPPLLLRAEGGCELLPGGGPALGMWDGAGFTARTATIDPGDTLVLYTDGVVEVADAGDCQFGVERLEQVVRDHAGDPVHVAVDAVVGATRAFSGRPAFDDDFTLVLVRRRADGRIQTEAH